MARFLLGHGAWHGGWCWDDVRTRLEANGHTVAAPDLPGHGSDTTPTGGVTLDAYVTRICHVLEDGEPAIVVGHSMGGMVISGVAERCPDAIQRLIYLCAFVPADGHSMANGGRLNTATTLHPANMESVLDGAGIMLKERLIRSAFYHDVPDDVAAQAQAKLVPQPAAVMGEKLSLSNANFGRVPKAYIECLEDQAVHLVAQRTMYRAAGSTDVATMDTGHSPFMSAADDLVAVLQRWA